MRLPVSSTYAAQQQLVRQARASASSVSVESSASERSSANLRADNDWAWTTWERLRHLCAYSPRLSVALDLCAPLPPAAALARWPAEPVGAVFLPARAFLANAKGFPVLSKASQALLRALLRRRPPVVLSGVHEPPARHSRGVPAAYLQYVRHLERSAPPESAVDVFARGYGDWLQAPLQPLMDNLEGTTYDVFERDPVKVSHMRTPATRAC